MTGADPWHALRRLTAARIALGRAGASQPTQALLEFGLAHARARDAVHAPLDAQALMRALQADGWETRQARSAAPDRATYLRRPDLGRRLDDADRAALAAHTVRAPDADHPPATPSLALVVADGLSALAVARHARGVLAELRPRLAGWQFTPVVAVSQGRVAVGDDVGEALGTDAVAVLIGERPGLSSPDSLGIYLSWAPRRGMHDAQRNCISNVRPEGLPYALAAFKLAWLLDGARRLGATGVGLKDDSDALLVDGQPPAPALPSTG